MLPLSRVRREIQPIVNVWLNHLATGNHPAVPAVSVLDGPARPKGGFSMRFPARVAMARLALVLATTMLLVACAGRPIAAPAPTASPTVAAAALPSSEPAASATSTPAASAA